MKEIKISCTVDSLQLSDFQSRITGSIIGEKSYFTDIYRKVSDIWSEMSDKQFRLSDIYYDLSDKLHILSDISA
jgi:hypothetical protein